jgi:hypothetical protein
VPLQAWTKDKSMVHSIVDMTNNDPSQPKVKMLTKTFQPHEVYADFTNLPKGVNDKLNKIGGGSEMQEVLVWHRPTTKAASASCLGAEPLQSRATSGIDAQIAYREQISPALREARVAAAAWQMECGNQDEADSVLRGHGSYYGSCGHKLWSCRCSTVHTPIQVDAKCYECSKQAEGNQHA